MFTVNEWLGILLGVFLGLIFYIWANTDIFINFYFKSKKGRITWWVIYIFGVICRLFLNIILLLATGSILSSVKDKWDGKK